MGNIFSKSAEVKELFKNESYLYPEHVPERLPHRDSEIDSLVFAFNPVLKGGKPQNVFLYGGTGTGKTATAKYVLKELEEFSDRAKSLYLNCFEQNTRHAVLASVANFLGSPIPRRGTGTDEIYDSMVFVLKKAGFTPIIVLDEIDQLHGASEASKLLYDLLRVSEKEKARFGLILISNDFSFTAKLDARVKSSLMEENIEFKQYTPEQLKDILRERAEYAFREGTLEKDVVSVAAAHAAKKGGDARIAIEALLKAGRIAERKNAEQVSLNHLRSAFESIDSAPVKKLVDSLNEEEKIVLKIIAGKDSQKSGEVYAAYCKKSKKPLTDRRFRDLVNKLSSLGLVNAPEIKEGMRGKTRQLSIAVPKKELEKQLDKD